METLVDTKLKIPGTLVICGSSSCGKTELVITLLDPRNQEATFGQKIDNIYYLYTIWQPAYDRLKQINPSVQFIESFTHVPKDLSDPHIVVWDDYLINFQSNRYSKRTLFDVCFRLSHHRNMFNIIVLQALFEHGLRNAILNSQYLTVFPVKSDMSAIRFVSQQMFPEKDSRFLQNALIDTAKDKWGYLFLDRSPNQDPKFTVRNFVFPKLNGKFYIQNGED